MLTDVVRHVVARLQGAVQRTTVFMTGFRIRPDENLTSMDHVLNVLDSHESKTILNN